MQLHQLIRNTKNKKARRVGRGGTRGKTSGRGTKGQLARSGRKLRPELRDIIKKLPKKRGYKFASIKNKPLVVKLSALEAAFSTGDAVDPKILEARGLINPRGRNEAKVKILATGTLTKKLIVSGCEVSAGAKEAIEKAGGRVEIVTAKVPNPKKAKAVKK
jgi:large subunit ribosomal protein L15